MILRCIHANFSRKALVLSTVLLATGMAALTVTPVAAGDDVIAERQEGFKAMGAAMKKMRKQMKSDAPDMAVMLGAAEKMAMNAPRIANWFPAGSGPESGKDTDALAYIWKNTDKFSRLSKAAVNETKALVTAVKTQDTAVIKKQLKVVMNTCKTCHKSFRED